MLMTPMLPRESSRKNGNVVRHSGAAWHSGFGRISLIGGEGASAAVAGLFSSAPEANKCPGLLALAGVLAFVWRGVTSVDIHRLAPTMRP